MDPLTTQFAELSAQLSEATVAVRSARKEIVSSKRFRRWSTTLLVLISLATGIAIGGVVRGEFIRNDFKTSVCEALNEDSQKWIQVADFIEDVPGDLAPGTVTLLEIIRRSNQIRECS